MDREAQRVLASRGGKAAHANGTAHEWDSQEARAAGSKGGRRSAEAKRLRKRLLAAELASPAAAKVAA
jgi:general stress protein YciG